MRQGPPGLPLSFDPLFQQGNALCFVWASPFLGRAYNDSKVVVTEVEKKQQWKQTDLCSLKWGSLNR